MFLAIGNLSIKNRLVQLCNDIDKYPYNKKAAELR